MMRLLMMASLFLIFSCERVSRSDRMRAFIPGDYERAVDDELSRRKIILRITREQDDHYAIERLAAVIRKQRGVEQPVHYDTAHWTAVYDERQQALYEQQKGKILLFFPGEKKLMIGGSAYQKIQ